MKILVCYGTRPEWIKIKPLLNAFKQQGIEYRVLNVRQHTSLLEGNSEVNYVLNIEDSSLNKNRLDSIVGNIANIPQSAFYEITHILVQGDTATALMCSIAAFNRQIPIIHLEAGLRTHDLKNPYPEEAYRQMISRIASIHLCPTEQNALNLKSEHVNGVISVVGNTVLDNLLELRNHISYGNEVLITLHRRENHDKINNWFEVMSLIATANPNIVYTLPIHPNPNVLKHKHLLKNVNIISALPYDQFLKRLIACRYLISDSGGIQEEASFLGKKVIVCRKITERPETVGLNSILCSEPSNLISTEEELKNNYIIEPNNTYGDGYSSIKIAKLLKNI